MPTWPISQLLLRPLVKLFISDLRFEMTFTNLRLMEAIPFAYIVRLVPEYSTRLFNTSFANAFRYSCVYAYEMLLCSLMF